MKRLDALLPDTLFGRLFAAIIAVVALTLLIIVLLIVRERREAALLGSSTGVSAANIVETSRYLAGLPPQQRRSVLRQLRAQGIALEGAGPLAAQLSRQRDNLSRHRQNMAQQAKVFGARVQRQLGREYRVFAVAPRARRGEVIPLQPEGTATDLQRRQARHHHSMALSQRVVDLVVVLPDGNRVIFRAPAPPPEVRLPYGIFVHLGILTVALSAVLYFMTRTITRPLADLARAADTIGRGGTTAPLRERGARELRGATRAFNAMQERLRRYLDSRTRVLAAMSHDLRTPLTRLRLRVESIEDEELRQRCATDLDEMASMVRNALSVFRGLNDEEPTEALDVNALLAALKEQHQELGGEVTLSGAALSPYPAKPLALKRCLGNLLQNAIRHGSRADVQIEDGENLVIRICDAGPGIPQDQLEQVFEPFFRLESSRSRDTGGTGLGLSIARDIAQAHGGSLVLSNRAAGGLEACLTLPRRASDAAAS